VSTIDTLCLGWWGAAVMKDVSGRWRLAHQVGESTAEVRDIQSSCPLSNYLLFTRAPKYTADRISDSGSSGSLSGALCSQYHSVVRIGPLLVGACVYSFALNQLRYGAGKQGVWIARNFVRTFSKPTVNSGAYNIIMKDCTVIPTLPPITTNICFPPCMLLIS